MKKILLLVLTVSLLVGCVDLLQEPLSSITVNNVTYDKKNTNALAGGLYKSLWSGNYGFNCRLQIVNVGADDVLCGTVTKRYFYIDRLNITPALHDGDGGWIWTGFYSLVMNANTFIEAITPATLITPTERDQYLGEAYYMRALAYFYLVRLFGEVPLFTDATCSKDIYGNVDKAIKRAPVSDVYEKMIIPDLKQAIAFLPNRSRTNDNSTVCVWAAKAMLADVYMTMAGWPLQLGTPKYAEARDICDDIITHGGYSLVPKYSDLWQEGTKSDPTEHIFALNHNVLYNASNYGKSYYAKEESDQAWSDYRADSMFYVRYPADKRKDFNFGVSAMVNGRKVPFTRWELPAPSITKYRSYDYGTPLSAQSNGITPICRLAEILLMYAEAQTKADGAPNTKSYDAINRVRARAMEVTDGSNDLTPNLSKDDFIKAVYAERGWEFFAEFKRWFELVRTERVWDENQYNPQIKKYLDDNGLTQDNRKLYLLLLAAKEIGLTGFPQNER